MVLGKKAKSSITLFVWVLSALAFFYTLVLVINPTEHTEERPVYSADLYSDIEYSVRLTDTPVFNKAKDADAAKYYIMPFTDYVNINCSYQLNSQTEALISADSYATAYLVSYIEDGNEEVVLWKKEYPLSNIETNETTGTNLSGEKNVKIDFSQYSVLIDQIYDMYNFKTSYYIMVLYSTEFNVEYNGITQTKTLQPYIRIDLEDFLFSIKENDISGTSIEINQQVSVSDEINWESVIVGSIIFVILAVLAILLPTRIVPSVQLSDSEKEIKRINIKYGDRIVNVVGKPEFVSKTAKVWSIEDIIKVSDEIGQPIFCVNADNEAYYYVIDNEIMYYIAIRRK